MHFKNREEAGRKLGERLAAYRESEAVVYALPRGGVPVGYEIASSLNVPLQILSIRKVGHPLSSEYAVCAVGRDGSVLCNEEEKAKIDPTWLSEEIKKERKEAERRFKLYTEDSFLSPQGKIAILVDDGAATGLTLRAGIAELKGASAKKIIVALPILPADTAKHIQKEADELVALLIDDDFLGAVGAYYDSFEQVSDEEVRALLSLLKHKKTSP